MNSMIAFVDQPLCTDHFADFIFFVELIHFANKSGNNNLDQVGMRLSRTFLLIHGLTGE